MIVFNDLKVFIEGVVLSFYNICYWVKLKSGFLFCWKLVEKEILLNINGIMKFGFNVILGFIGGGKFLLLDVLVVRKDLSGLFGDVLINGVLWFVNFKCNLGYVV